MIKSTANIVKILSSFVIKVEAILSCNASVFIEKISFPEAVMVTKSLWVSVVHLKKSCLISL